MSRQQRLGLIKKIEEARGSRLIVYFTGDRSGLQTRIATDIFPFLLEHLEHIGNTKKLDLFLYTPGGMTIAGTGLVTLFREYCEKFGVIIPFKAHSAGTLIALGADSIVMSKVAQLSPVDPSVQSPYNPAAPGNAPGNPGNLLPVNVEEVIGFLNLAKEEAGIKTDEAMASVFKELSSRVHPLALGSVFRARAQIRMLATQLLTRHMGIEKKAQIDTIVTKLTEELYSHDYIVGRKEAKEALGLNIEDENPETDSLIWKLYKQYESLLELTIPLTPELILGRDDEKRVTFTRGLLESRLRTDGFQSDQSFKRITMTPPGAPAPQIVYQSNVFSQYWVRNIKV